MSAYLRCICCLVVLLSLSVLPSPAQTVAGTLVDRASHRALADVTVSLTNTATRKQAVAKSDTLGNFEFRSLRAGDYALSVEHGGHSYVHELNLVISERLHLAIDVPSDESAMAVTGTSSRVYKLETNGFYERYQKGRGQFLVREDIEKKGARSLADALANVRGVRIDWGARGGDAILRSGGGAGALSGGGVCRPSLYLDGVLVRAGGNQEPQLVLEQVETPDHVEAIEVYAGASQLPSAYSGVQGACGAILIWTR